jgi:ssRNA-specific RNase YbeY (16S rRNA maturation enzyme)
VSPTRYVNKDKGTNVLAFQFPEEGLDFIRKVWKQPTAKAGDWLVKRGTDTRAPSHKLLTNEQFQATYKKPESGR